MLDKMNQGIGIPIITDTLSKAKWLLTLCKAGRKNIPQTGSPLPFPARA
jgi:hypothetical protein